MVTGSATPPAVLMIAKFVPRIYLSTEHEGKMKGRRSGPVRFAAAAFVLAAAADGHAAMSPESERVRNLTSHGNYDQPVRLTDGVYKGEPFMSRGASRPRVQLRTELSVVADLDGDDVEEVAVLLAELSGGSGEFIHLAVVA